MSYPDDSEAGISELQEIVRRTQSEGSVLLWCEILNDYIAFYMTEQDLRGIPPGFVPYSIQELLELFGEGKGAPSEQMLVRVHAAKKAGCKVVGSHDAL